MATQAPAPSRDKEITDYAATELMTLPKLLRQAETLVFDLNLSARETKRLLGEAETDAQINATVTGKNAESRKLELEAAVNNDPSVEAIHATLSNVEQQYALAEADYNDLGRRWKAAVALAELQAAKIRWLATFEKKQ